MVTGSELYKMPRKKKPEDYDHSSEQEKAELRAAGCRPEFAKDVRPGQQVAFYTSLFGFGYGKVHYGFVYSVTVDELEGIVIEHENPGYQQAARTTADELSCVWVRDV